MKFLTLEKTSQHNNGLNTSWMDWAIYPTTRVINTDRIIDVIDASSSDCIDLELLNKLFILHYRGKDNEIFRFRVYGDIQEFGKLVHTGGILPCSDSEYLETHHKWKN